MTKLLENIYRCVNIALVNELKLLCLRMGIDIWEVIGAASTKPPKPQLTPEEQKAARDARYAARKARRKC